MASDKIILQMTGLRLDAVMSGAPIVKSVDLELRAGQVLGLIGESGAGKSTIGLAAMGYARAGVHIAGGTCAPWMPKAAAPYVDAASPTWRSQPLRHSIRRTASWTRSAKRRCCTS